MAVKILRVMVALSFSGLGAFVGGYLPVEKLPSFQSFDPRLIPGIGNGIGLFFGLIIGILLAPWVANNIIRFVTWLEQKLHRIPIQEVIGGSLGLITGLIIAILSGEAFSAVPVAGALIKSVGALLFGYLGLNLGYKKKDELFGVPFLSRFNKEKTAKSEPKGLIAPKILDTSVIIDGRIADIVKCGFVEGTLVIPNFVLEELRHIADSSDLLKRNRGRRGLDILNKVRKELGMKVLISEKDFEDISEVDSKLVKLAQVMEGKIVTNDFNLNKVAELQGVGVLNINELANAVKPVVLPGEEMVVQVVKDGKESGQGVGYLDDGTMIVIDNGKKYMGQTITVMVTSVLQTAAGRMIFAKAKLEKRTEQSGQTQLNEVNAIG